MAIRRKVIKVCGDELGRVFRPGRFGRPLSEPATAALKSPSLAPQSSPGTPPTARVTAAHA